MGVCWSDPPPPPVTTTQPLQACRYCGAWTKGSEYCEPCLQKNAMRYIAPSAPPMYPPQATYQAPQYTYAIPYQQQQMYNYYQARPPQPVQQPQQTNVAAAVLGGFVLGAIAEDILDPTD